MCMPVKRSDSLWVFGAIRGTKYMDNAKYLFEYVNDHTPITAVWITKNPEVVETVRRKGYLAYLENTKEARHYASRARLAVITHRGNRHKADIPMHYFSCKTKIVQLWHGIPLKKIAFDDKIFSFRHNEESLQWKIKVFLKNTLFPFLNYVNKPVFIPALSEETREIFSRAFRVPANSVRITGYPRNDILIENAGREPVGKKKKIIYMPTFRNSVNSHFDLFLQYGFDLDEFDDFLEKTNMELDIKLHPFNQPSEELRKRLEVSRNIHLLEYDAIYEILHQYSMLITDYSSVYFDYLLLDRPVIFTPFDKEEYLKKDREFYFDYDEVTPGPKAMSWGEVMLHMERFHHDPSLYREQRWRVRDRFHTYQDAGSTQRVFNAVQSLLT